ncbi:MAG: mRNA surveillance protein pelota [Desulfurococcaceae archaeon]
MRIVEEDLKRGSLKLLVETLDDLWVLYNIVNEGDTIYAKTTREVKVGDNSHGSRLPMTLGIKVQRVEFQQFSDKLRVGGLIVNGPEKYGVKGKHHTLSIGVGDVLVIVKDKWEDPQLELIKRFATRREALLIIGIDYDEVCVGALSEQGVKYLWEEVHNMPSKMYQVDYNELVKGFAARALRAVEEIIQREEVKAVIIAGPGDMKSHLRSELLSKISLPIYIDSTSTGGCQGVREVLNRDVVKEVVSDLNIVRAKGALEDFKRLLVLEDQLVAYGLEEVHRASLIGAISKLLVADELLKLPEEEERQRVLDALRNASNHRAEIIVVPSKSDVGLELLGFGGIVAILRFKLGKI